MSPAQLLKRALVTILLELARVYALDLGLTRNSPDTNVKKAFRRVILRAHPDKAGGSEAASKKLNAAWSQWLEAGRSKHKPGPSKTASATGALVPKAKKPEYRFQGKAALLTYQGIVDVSQWHAFLDFVDKNKGKWRLRYWTATFETNLDGTLHAHLTPTSRLRTSLLGVTGNYFHD